MAMDSFIPLAKKRYIDSSYTRSLIFILYLQNRKKLYIQLDSQDGSHKIC